LPFRGFKSLSLFQYQKLQNIFKKVYICAKEDKFCFKANLILDDKKIYSPLFAIKQVLEEINSSVFILGVDIPLVSSKTIEKILDSYEQNYEAVVAKTSNLEPLCGIYSPNLLPKINQMLEKNIHKLNYLLKSSDTLTVEVNPKEFVNLNYLKDYQNLIKKEKI
jgi:molybdopterin-guanine dinucleotide biosynthesis protein A